MKKLLLYSLFAFAVLLSPSVMAQQGIGTNEPDKSSAVDIVSTKRGLLIPRIQLSSTDQATPVANPAQSLLVYNLLPAGSGDTAVTSGFYYWDTDHWVRFVDGDAEKSVVVAAGENIDVDSSTLNNETTYTVNVENGGADNLVMVTQSDGSGGFETAWVTYDELIDAENGLTYDETTGKLELGGPLTKNTIISTDTFELLFDVSAVGGAIKFTNLPVMDPNAVPAGATIAVMDGNGVLQTYDLATLIDDLTVPVNNGLTKVNDTIQLGGALIKPTVLTTDATNTLAVDGLQSAAAENEIVVAEAGGVLRTVKRTLFSGVITSDLSVDGIANYSPYVQEINVSATLSATDIDVTLPAANPNNNGQVVNIKITNEDDTHDGFLNIMVGAVTLTYGTMPYQGWVIKSNGADWVIVGRN